MKKLLLVFLMLSMGLLGCVPATLTPLTAMTITALPRDAMATAVAQTVSALEATRVASLSAVPFIATPTIEATPTLTPRPTIQVVQPQDTPLTGFCDSLSFLGDVTIPDDVMIPPGTVFKKIWAIKNSGQCTWNSSYSLVWVGGDQLGAPVEVPLLKEGQVVYPGEMALATVEFVAPQPVAGEPDRSFISYWKLRNASGGVFGWGTSADRSFYVKIRSGNTFSFVDNPCSAVWSNNSGLLYCPTKSKDPAGYFLQEKSPKVESGIVAGYSLVMVPPQQQDGEIRARFSPIMVPSGSYLRSAISCAFGDARCNFNAKILFTVDGGEEKVLAEWNKYYDGFVEGIGIDLKQY
ncbi:MAG: NBR1-Ig-like domain-containing protein, partial [Anaerolineales bacterium]